MSFAPLGLTVSVCCSLPGRCPGLSNPSPLGPREFDASPTTQYSPSNSPPSTVASFFNTAGSVFAERNLAAPSAIRT